MTNFTDLSTETKDALFGKCDTFETDNLHGEGFSYRYHFANGWGVSCVKNHSSYGGERDLWELALLHYESGAWKFFYCTGHNADDPSGYLEEQTLVEYCNEVADYENVVSGQYLLEKIWKRDGIKSIFDEDED